MATTTEPRPVPRLFLVRHGETEWSQNGWGRGHSDYVFGLSTIQGASDLTADASSTNAWTDGMTDIPLTEHGESQVRKIASRLVGEGLAIEPHNLCTVYVSPRKRAQRTFELLFDHLGHTPPHIFTEDVAEWDYGKYEGLKSSEIAKIDSKWAIWKDGCPEGESIEQMQQRVDDVIAKVKSYHRRYKEQGINSRDVLIVAHGHFSRVLISRWINFPLALGTHFNVEPGSVAVLSYNHNSLDEPALNALNLFAVIR